MQSWAKKVFGFGLASFFSDFSHEMTVALVPILVAQLVGMHQAPFILGVISSVTDLCASFLRIGSGFISDKLARKKPLIAVGYVLSAVFSMLVGFAHSIGGIFIYRILSFAGSGLREPPRDALIAATVKSEYYGRAFGLKSGMDTLGSLIGPLVALACAGFFSMQEIFILSFIPGIFSVLAIIFFTYEKVTSGVQKKISLSAMRYDFLQLPHSFFIFLSIIFIFDLSFFNKLLLLARAHEMLAGTAHVTQMLIFLYAIFNGVRALSEFTLGLLSDYMSRIFLLAFFGCGLFTGAAFLLCFSQASIVYCSMIFVLMGISTAATTTLKKACAADMLPVEIRGFGYGILQAAEGFAVLISNILIGYLWTHYSAFYGFSYAIVMSSIAMIFLVVFGAKK